MSFGIDSSQEPFGTGYGCFEADGWMCSVPHPGQTVSSSSVWSSIHLMSWTTCFVVRISRHLSMRSWKIWVFCWQRDLSFAKSAKHSFKFSQRALIFSLWSKILRPCCGVISNSFCKIPAIGFCFGLTLFWPSVQRPIFVKLVGLTSLWKQAHTILIRKLQFIWLYTKILDKLHVPLKLLQVKMEFVLTILAIIRIHFRELSNGRIHFIPPRILF